MKIHWAGLAAIGLALGVAPMAVAYADKDEAGENEHEVSLESIPRAARDALVAGAAGAPILKVEQATEEGQTTYSAHVKTPKGVIEITVDANGKLLRQGPEDDKD